MDFFEEKDDIKFQYIEENLKTIDVKIKGFKKIERIPIDNNGVYSYQTYKMSGDNQQNKLGASMFVSSKGS